MKKVVSFGEILLRLSAPGYSKLFQKDSLISTFCGSEANVAVSLALFGMDSAFITKVPQNEIGMAAVNSLKYFGVNTKHIVYSDGRLGLYYLENGASQRPSKVIYDRANSTFALAEKKDFDWEEILSEACWFHFSGINPALSTNIYITCLNACRIAKDKDIMISCDLNYRKNLWSKKDAQVVMEKLMPYIDVCIGNEEDIETTLGIEIKGNDIENGIVNPEGYEEAASEICEKYNCRYVAFTLRESYSASNNGWVAMLFDRSKKQAYYSEKYNIQIVDRVGSGDSFAAGLIYSLVKGKSNQEIVEFATAASCLKHTIEGDYNRTTVEDVENLLRNGGSGRIIR